MAQQTPSKQASTPASGASAPAASGNMTRQLVLGGVLVVLLGMLAYDYLALAPAVAQTKKKLDEFVDEKNKAGIPQGENAEKVDRSTYLVTAPDVRKVIGWGPTWKQDKGYYTMECYRFWGPIPLARHYITVVYIKGKNGQPDRHSAHYLNSVPEESERPQDPATIKAPPVDPNAKTNPRPSGGVRPPGETPSTDTPPSDTPPSDTPPGEPSTDAPAKEDATAKTPPSDTPPSDTPPKEDAAEKTPPAEEDKAEEK